MHVRAKMALVITHDLLMAASAFVLAFFLRLGTDGFLDYHYQDVLLSALPFFIGCTAISFVASGIYRNVWHYASLRDLLQIIRAISIAVLLFTLTLFIVNRLAAMPRSITIIAWFVAIVAIAGPRILYRLHRSRRSLSVAPGSSGQRTPVLLAGTNQETELFIRATLTSPQSRFQVTGLLDTSPRRVGQTIHGIPILGRVDDIETVLEKLESRRRLPATVVVLRSRRASMTGDRLRKILDAADRYGLMVAEPPSMTDLTTVVADNGPALQPIPIEDLLERTPQQLDRAPIRALIGGKRVLITGAGGSIGSELSRQIAALDPARLVLIENGEFNLYEIDLHLRDRFPTLDLASLICDVRDPLALDRIFARERPELVFHAAALKHVPLVESNRLEGLQTNALGSRNVAEAAAAAGVRAMVMISTDKAVRPTNVMGASKRMAEAYCQALDAEIGGRSARGEAGDTRFVVVRFGNVLGSKGSVVPLFQKQLAEGGPLTVTHPDMERFMMTIREAVELVLHTSTLGMRADTPRGRIYVLDMGRPLKIINLARQMIRFAGLEPDVDIKIEITGLRPGEKLYEELFDPREVSPSPLPGILIGTARVVELPLLKRAFDQLGKAITTGDETAAMRIVSSIVPDYGEPERTDSSLSVS